MAEIIWTEPAVSDLEGIAEYIALDKPEAAARLVQDIFRHVEMLRHHPEAGSWIPELRPARTHRQIVEPPCRIFYRHDQAAAKVHILGGMRGERLFQSALLLQRDAAPEAQG